MIVKWNVSFLLDPLAFVVALLELFGGFIQ